MTSISNPAISGDIASQELPPRNIQLELREAYNNSLAFPAAGFAARKAGRWQSYENRVLLGILNHGDNYKKMNQSPKKFWDEFAETCHYFRGFRSPSAIRAHVGELRKRFVKAKTRVECHIIDGNGSEKEWAAVEQGKLASYHNLMYSRLIIT